MSFDQVRIPNLVIIDDEEFDQMMYRRIVDRSNIVGNLHSFYSGEEAFQFLMLPDTPPIDVILLDINMPGMSGFDFLEKVTEAGSSHIIDIVVVMLTTSLAAQDVARARSFDLVKDYLNKPLEESHLPYLADLLEGNRDAA